MVTKPRQAGGVAPSLFQRVSYDAAGTAKARSACVHTQRRHPFPAPTMSPGTHREQAHRGCIIPGTPPSPGSTSLQSPLKLPEQMHSQGQSRGQVEEQQPYGGLLRVGAKSLMGASLRLHSETRLEAALTERKGRSTGDSDLSRCFPGTHLPTNVEYVQTLLTCSFLTVFPTQSSPSSF